MNLHLVNDAIFVNLSRRRFEHYYPGENLFVVGVPRRFSGNLRFVEEREGVKKLSFNTKEAVEQLEAWTEGKEAHLFVHFLIPSKARVALEFKRRRPSTKLYWIFYGADLYQMLHRRGIYQLSDEPEPWWARQDFGEMAKDAALSVLLRHNLFAACRRFIRQMDYFCFWNPYDFELLREHFDTRAEFRFFRYYEAPLGQADPTAPKEAGTLFLNHSASRSGNHVAMMKRLLPWIRPGGLQRVLVPLSYGSPSAKPEVMAFGRAELGEAFEPVLDFLPKEQYFEQLNRIGLALFGHNRQEAGNNIYFFLASGAKVFLRSRNNLLKYLRDKGYYIFEVERDLEKADAMEMLSEEEKNHNHCLATQEFSQAVIDDTYRQLVAE
jgi:dTDP-N-acetylfucosamine:lipid II N-acetylfucosaminyltransferase